MKISDLIEKATKKAGGQRHLAAILGVGPNRVGDWQKLRVPCQPADQARIADIAGENAADTLINATIEQSAGTLRGEQLEAALKKNAPTVAKTVRNWAGVSPMLNTYDARKCITRKNEFKKNAGFSSDELSNLGFQ